MNVEDGYPAPEWRGRRLCGEASGMRRARQLCCEGASYPATGGASGLPISWRRLRNASEPITAGIHSEIAR